MDPHLRARPSPLNLLVPESPPPGSLTPVADGLFWLRVQLPFRLNHINLWLIRELEGWALIDTGIGDAATQAIWTELLTTRLPEPRHVTKVIATHYHPDHIGNAGWLVEQSQAPFYAPLTEWAYARMLSLLTEAVHLPTIERFYRQFGLDEPTVTAMVTYGNHYARNVTPIPSQVRRLRDGEPILLGSQSWQVTTHGGHTPEHMCLYNAAQNVLIAGDQVLPFISPNISVSFFEPDADPLSDYFASLQRLRALPAHTLVLPSHGLPFHNLHMRLSQLEQHHHERLEQILRFVTEPRTVAEIMRHLFPQDLDRHQIMFAIGEAAAHANHLSAQGKLKRTLNDNGVVMFRVA